MGRMSIGAAVVGLGFGLGCAGLELDLEDMEMEPAEIPADRADLVGHWTGPGAVFDLFEDGTMNWSRQDGGKNTNINGLPVVAWTETGFVVGMGPVKKPFTVDEGPVQDDAGTWSVILQGVEVTR